MPVPVFRPWQAILPTLRRANVTGIRFKA